MGHRRNDLSTANLLHELKLRDTSRSSEHSLVSVHRVYSEYLQYFDVDMKCNVAYKGGSLQLTICRFYSFGDGIKYLLETSFAEVQDTREIPEKEKLTVRNFI